MLKLTTWLNKKRYTLLWSLFLLLTCLCISAQEPLSHLTIDEVYQMARANYPLVKQKGLISKTKEYTVSNASKGYLPAFSINGQATYQSDVTSFPFKIPIPGFTLPSYSKDQYKVYGELDQVIYDGGLIKNQQQTAETNEMVQQQNLEVSLYSLYDRLDQLYFGILLVKQQLLQNKILQKDIQNGIDKAKALVANGTAYRSSVDELSAQLLQAEQSAVEITATQKAYLDMLGLFINKKLDTDTELEKPVSPPITETINRPEVFYYDFQKKTLDLQDQLLKTQLRPKFSLYLQGGYGRPGLNMLNNDFAFFGIAGARVNWNLGSLYTYQNQKQLVDLNRKSLDVQKETFLLNTGITQKQQSADMAKYRALIKKDEGIIALRASVKNAASAQLENGVLSAHDYLTQVNAEDQARQNLILHQVQLLLSEFNYQSTTGNSKK